MRLLLTTLSVIGLSTIAFAQASTTTSPGSQSAGGPAQFDANGDPIAPSVPGTNAPGDLWASITSPLASTNGVANYQGGLLVSNGTGSIVHIDEAGATLGSFVTGSASDSWLGYDASRDIIITTNATTDTISGYTFGTTVPLFSLPTPTPGPVGAAWDSTRDEYAYCDWDADVIVIYDANTLAVVRTFNYAGTLNRMAGLAYDCTDDVYIVGDRDAQAHYLINPVTGAIGLSYLTAGAGSSIPRGAALSSDGGVWVGDWGLNGMYLQEAGHGPTTQCGGGSAWTVFCSGDGTDTACPCGNVGAPGAGCANSTGSGAVLGASGSADVLANDLVLSGSGLPPGVPSLFFAGASPITPGALFGDGLRCAGGQVTRLEIVFVSAAGTASTSVGIASTLGATPGQNSILQLWYRDPAGPCSAQFNTSTALDLTWQ